MNDQISTLKDDLAFMRVLAQGQDGPNARDAAILISAGLIYALTSLAMWAVSAGLIRIASDLASFGWLAATAVFLVSLILLKGGAARAGRSSGGRAASRVWAGVGCAIFTLFVCAGLVSWRTQSSTAMLLMPSVVLALYGTAWSVAAVTAKRWMGIAAAGSFLLAMITAAVCTSPLVFLVYAVALTLLATVPGIVLMRQAQTAGA